MRVCVYVHVCAGAQAPESCLSIKKSPYFFLSWLSSFFPLLDLQVSLTFDLRKSPSCLLIRPPSRYRCESENKNFALAMSYSEL